MKTYEQVVQHAVLIGAHRYFNGGNYWEGAHGYINAVDFIYEVDREKFLDDFKIRWDEVMKVRTDKNLYADQVIAYIKENLICTF